MARLSDLVNTSYNKRHIVIQGTEIPVAFTFASFEYVQEAYGKSYEEFEDEMNRMLNNPNGITLDKQTIKLMTSLIYSMIRSGGHECTPEEVMNSIPQSELVPIFETSLEIFNDQNFQKEDEEKIKQTKK